MHLNLKGLTSIASVFRSFMKLLQKSCSIRPTDLMVRHKFRCRSDKNAKKSGGKEVTIPNREREREREDQLHEHKSEKLNTK